MNCGLSTWEFNIDSSNEKEKNKINDFIYFSDCVDCPFLLDLKRTKYSFIEKIVYDTIQFHCNRLNIEIDDKVVSFWSKNTEYNLDYIHMHIDHCDYECRMFDREVKKPLFTAILYFNENDNPTLITDVTREMCDKMDFLNSKNTKLAFCFPKNYKSVVFDSGNYYHGESYLQDYKQKERNVIVIALWNKENKPDYLPYFDFNLLNYFIFVKNTESIEEIEYDKRVDLITFKEKTNDIIVIKINHPKIIDNDFYIDLLIKKKKDAVYRLNNIIKIINNPDTIIIDFSKLVTKNNSEE
jgi:hypothetical protein